MLKYQTLKNRTASIPRGLLLLLSLLAFWSCLAIQEEPDPDVYVSLTVDDSLLTFDRVRIVVLSPAPREDTLDVLWDGPLKDTAALAGLKTRHYKGGKARILIQAFDGEEEAHRTVTHFQGEKRPRKVDTVQVEDRTPPKLLWLQPDSTFFTVGTSLPLLAVCLDRRDGRSTPDTLETVPSGREGIFPLRLRCRDRAGNVSAADSLLLTFRLPQDTKPPVLTLLGQDSLDHVFGNTYTDAGAVCFDDKDGERPVTRTGTVDVTKLGRNELAFVCRDAAGNQAEPRRRVVRVVRYEYIDAHKETAIDTNEGTSGYRVNAGCMAMLTFAPPTYTHSFPFAFELDHVDRLALKSAKATFQTYISGPVRPFSNVKVTFRVYRVMSTWEEGDGSWYFRDRKWYDSGEVLFRNHDPREEIKARARDPWYGGGLTGETGRELVRLANMDRAGMDTLWLSYPESSFSKGAPGVIPRRENLVQVEIDLTEYVKGTGPGEDHGLVILAEGMPFDTHINWATKELGDGTLGPRLRLTY